MTAKLVLSQADRGSACWQNTEAYLKATLAELRERNDSDLSDIDTAKVRGKIELVKGMLSAAKGGPKYLPAADHTV